MYTIIDNIRNAHHKNFLSDEKCLAYLEKHYIDFIVSVPEGVIESNSIAVYRPNGYILAYIETASGCQTVKPMKYSEIRPYDRVCYIDKNKSYELKPCPFCGHDTAEFETMLGFDEVFPEVPYVRVSCRNCAVSTMWLQEKGLPEVYPGKYSYMFPDVAEPLDGKKTAAEMWNRRQDKPNFQTIGEINKKENQ